jgi:hypothetical protein
MDLIVVRQQPAVVCRGLTFCYIGGDRKIKIHTENWATEKDNIRLWVVKLEFILKLQILQ